jgi:transcriptional regulator with XRE-family HTH domain
MTIPNGLDIRAIGQRLKLAREALGYGQKEFAAGAEIAGNAYNQYEQARTRPSIDNANALCDVYRLTLDYIYRGDVDSLPPRLARSISDLATARAEQKSHSDSRMTVDSQ